VTTADALGRYAQALYANQGNAPLVALAPRGPSRILDVGCGAGDNARLLGALGHQVWGVTASAREAEVARRHCMGVSICDLEQPLPPGLPAQLDVLFCSHVLEHLRDPMRVLRELSRLLVPSGQILVAVPNMASWRLRVQQVRGDWTRTESGPLDRTHLQFWSYESIAHDLREAGFRILTHTGEFSLPQRPLRRLAPGVAGWLDVTLGSQVPGLAAAQTLIVATPGVD
jgi:2-polyprenyl-3-methyl-5-hydroxy-6-metoxy-1,4-benzoquinol methylase